MRLLYNNFNNSSTNLGRRVWIKWKIFFLSVKEKSEQKSGRVCNWPILQNLGTFAIVNFLINIKQLQRLLFHPFLFLLFYGLRPSSAPKKKFISFVCKCFLSFFLFLCSFDFKLKMCAHTQRWIENNAAIKWIEIFHLPIDSMCVTHYVIPHNWFDHVQSINETESEKKPKRFKKIWTKKPSGKKIGWLKQKK